MFTQDGHLVSCELWPSNHVDVQALLPVVDRMRERLKVRRVCWVADRGMVSEAAIQGLEERGLEYILGARLRNQQEVRDTVLAWVRRHRKVADNPWVKEVRVDGRRYIVCLNPEEAVKDAAEQKATVQALKDKLREGAGQIDGKKVAAEGRYDRKFVLRTNSDLPAEEVARQYKRLLLVEQFFRAIKDLLETRPIYHQWGATIRGTCSAPSWPWCCWTSCRTPDSATKPAFFRAPPGKMGYGVSVEES